MLLPGRSENAIKNRFALLWKKYKKRKSSNDVTDILLQISRKNRRRLGSHKAAKLELEEVPAQAE